MISAVRSPVPPSVDPEPRGQSMSQMKRVENVGTTWKGTERETGNDPDISCHRWQFIRPACLICSSTAFYRSLESIQFAP
jgi:hypothetical protein